MRQKRRLKSEKRAKKKKKRRYPVSGRGAFIIQKIKGSSRLRSKNK